MLKDMFKRGWKNERHCFSTRFAAVLQNRLHVSVAPITVALE